MKYLFTIESYVKIFFFCSIFVFDGNIPNIPRFETVIVPPWNSCGCSLPSRALAANSLINLLISTKPLRSACGTIGVIRPLSVATATEQSTESYLKNISSKALAKID